jgi:hypothetical protein
MRGKPRWTGFIEPDVEGGGSPSPGLQGEAESLCASRTPSYFRWQYGGFSPAA